MNANGFHTLSLAQVEQFRRDGFLVVENLLSEDDMAAVRDRADEIAGGRAPHVPDDCVQVEPGLRDGPLPEDRALAVRNQKALPVTARGPTTTTSCWPTCATLNWLT